VNALRATLGRSAVTGTEILRSAMQGRVVRRKEDMIELIKRWGIICMYVNVARSESRFGGMLRLWV